MGKKKVEPSRDENRGQKQTGELRNLEMDHNKSQCQEQSGNKTYSH